MSNDDTQVVPFAAVVQQIERGHLADELSYGLQQVVAAVMETHRGGTITLTLKITKSKIHNAIEIDPVVLIKPPKFDRGTSMFFADSESNLTRNDPDQGELFGGPTAVPDTTTKASNA